MADGNLTLKKLRFKYISCLFLSIIMYIAATAGFIYGYKLTQTPVLAVLLFHDVLEKPQAPWEITPNKLYYYIDKLLALKYKPVDPNNFENLLNNGFEGRHFMVTFDDGSENEYYAIENLYKKYGIKSVLFILEDRFGVPRNITVEGVKTLQKECGTYLGLHGRYHKRYTDQLKRKTDLGKITEESRIKLSNMFNCNLKWIAYPFGDYNQKVIEELKTKTAANLAFTIESGNLNNSTDKMALNRYMYLGGQNPNGEDNDFNLGLLPPADYSNGQLIITLSAMVFFFALSRSYLCWKYYKALQILKIKA